MDVMEKLVELLCEAQHIVTNTNKAEYLADHGVTVQEWIPFSAPPKEKGCYFVTVKHWLDGNPVAREAYWNGSDWLSCEKRQEITPRVTHWMPLPEPQEEDA